jgi:hypothetical protein
LAALSLVACVLCGLPQGDRDDKRKQALNRRRQPLDHAQVTAAVSCRDQEPADNAAKTTVTVAQPQALRIHDCAGAGLATNTGQTAVVTTQLTAKAR